jgi:hypothetical protein
MDRELPSLLNNQELLGPEIPQLVREFTSISWIIHFLESDNPLLGLSITHTQGSLSKCKPLPGVSHVITKTAA